MTEDSIICSTSLFAGSSSFDIKIPGLFILELRLMSFTWFSVLSSSILLLEKMRIIYESQKKIRTLSFKTISTVRVDGNSISTVSFSSKAFSASLITSWGTIATHRSSVNFSTYFNVITFLLISLTYSSIKRTILFTI